MLEEIFAAAKPLTTADEATLRAFCQSAYWELAGHLRPGVRPEDCGERFTLAAAMLACAGCEDGVASFTVADVSVTKSGSRAQALRRAAQAMIQTEMEDSLCFLRMKG